MGGFRRRPTHWTRLSHPIRGDCDYDAGHICLGEVAFFRSGNFGRRTSEPSFRGIGASVRSALVNDFYPEPREDSLRFAILPSGDGSARGTRGRVSSPLGPDGTRCNGAHGVSQPSDGRGSGGVVVAVAWPSLQRDRGRSARGANLALASAQSEST